MFKRYTTKGGIESDRLTKRESVAMMNLKETGIKNTDYFMMGVDRTQGIALDEIFRKSSVTKTIVRKTDTGVDESMDARAFRKSRAGRTTTGALGVDKEGEEKRTTLANPSDASADGDEAEDEIILVPAGICARGICGPGVRMNLICMTWVWIATQTCYFIINFYLKYIPGSEFLNFSIAGISEILAHITVGLAFGKLGPRCMFLVGFLISLAGSIPLLFQNSIGDNAALIAFFVLLAKYGCSMAYCACFISTPILFPIRIASTAFGFCNIFGRLFAASAPFIAELNPPVPMAVFTLLALISIFVVIPIKPYGGVDDEPQKIELTNGKLTMVSASQSCF